MSVSGDLSLFCNRWLKKLLGKNPSIRLMNIIYALVWVPLFDMLFTPDDVNSNKRKISLQFHSLFLIL